MDIRIVAGGALLAVVSIGGRALAQEAHVTRVPADAADDVYLAGAKIEVQTPVAGDVVAAGQQVRVESEVGEDLLVAAERVRVNAAVGDDIRAAGREVRVLAPVGGHAVLAGERVVLGEGVGAWAWIAGGDIEVLGSVGNLRADGDEVTIAGEVRGDAEVRGKSIRIGPEAVVQGDLRWSGPNPPTVLGEVRGASIEVPAGDRGGDAVAMLFWIVSLMLAVMLLLLAMPGWGDRVGAAARTATWRSVGVGLLVLIGTPFLIALSFLVGVLWIVGLLLLALYALALIGGALLGVVAAGDLALDLAHRERPSRLQRVAAAGLAALIVAALVMVPVLGPIVLLVLTAVGIGAMGVSLWRGGERRGAVPVGSEPAPA